MEDEGVVEVVEAGCRFQHLGAVAGDVGGKVVPLERGLSFGSTSGVLDGVLGVKVAVPKVRNAKGDGVSHATGLALEG